MNNYRNFYETPQLFFHHAIDYNPLPEDFQMHLHIHYEIYCLISGGVNYVVENREYPLKPGSILLIRPMEYHMAKILNSDKYERYCVIFPGEILDFVDPQQKLLVPFNSRQFGKPNIFTPSDFSGDNPIELFKAMCVNDPSPETKRTAILSNLYALLWKLLRAYENKEKEKENSTHSLTDQILMYINSHLFDDISIQSISERFFISPSYLHRLIKNSVGTSVWKYIMLKRLSVAQNEIQNGSAAIEVSRKCGFKDYSAFYRAYIKQYGISPTNDRISNIKDEK